MENKDHSPEVYKVNVNGEESRLIAKKSRKEIRSCYITVHREKLHRLTEFLRRRNMCCTCADRITPSG